MLLKARHARFNRNSDIFGPQMEPFQGRSLSERPWVRQWICVRHGLGVYSYFKKVVTKIRIPLGDWNPFLYIVLPLL